MSLWNFIGLIGCGIICIYMIVSGIRQDLKTRKTVAENQFVLDDFKRKHKL